MSRNGGSLVLAAAVVMAPSLSELCQQTNRHQVVQVDGFEEGEGETAVLLRGGALMVGNRQVRVERKSFSVFDLAKGDRVLKPFSAVYIGRQPADLALAHTLKRVPNLLPSSWRGMTLLFPGAEYVLRETYDGCHCHDHLVLRNRANELKFVLRDICA